MNKLLKAAHRNSSRVVAAAALMAVSAAHSAMATGIDISADVTQAKTDVQTNGALIVSVVVAVAAIAWIRRVIR